MCCHGANAAMTVRNDLGSSAVALYKFIANVLTIVRQCTIRSISFKKSTDILICQELQWSVGLDCFLVFSLLVILLSISYIIPMMFHLFAIFINFEKELVPEIFIHEVRSCMTSYKRDRVRGCQEMRDCKKRRVHKTTKTLLRDWVSFVDKNTVNTRYGNFMLMGISGPIRIPISGRTLA